MSATDSVLQYLQTQNRPYSANDITQNLHKEFGKTAIQKALDELSRDKKILEKTYGKQKVYSVLQDSDSNYDPAKMREDIVALESEAGLLAEEISKIDAATKVVESKLKTCQSLSTTEKALKEAVSLQEEIEKLKTKLDSFQKTHNDLNQKQIQMDKDQILKENEIVLKAYTKRKRICNDIVDSILEGYPKNKKALVEELGIETDEEVGFVLPKL